MKLSKVFLNSIITTSFLLASSVLQAQEHDNRANVKIGALIYNFDAERNQDDDTGYAIGAEYPLSGRWSVAADYLSLDSNIEPANAFESDIDYLRLGVNYYLNKFNGLQPYIGVGLGKLSIDPEVSSPNEAMNLPSM